MFRFFFFLLSVSFAFSQTPTWLSKVAPPREPPPPPAAPASPAAAVASPSSSPSVVYREKVKIISDTVYVDRIDTLTVHDTLFPPPPSYYSYTVYYEVLDKAFSLHSNFAWDWEKTAQKTTLQSSDTTLLSLGTESMRSVGYTYDNLGNKTETLERVIDGLDMRVNGPNVNVTYRVGASLLSLSGRFDNSGLLLLSSDFSRRRYFLYFIPLDFLFSSQKLVLFLRIEKRGVL
jgi:hypothetical protein